MKYFEFGLRMLAVFAAVAALMGLEAWATVGAVWGALPAALGVWAGWWAEKIAERRETR